MDISPPAGAIWPISPSDAACRSHENEPTACKAPQVFGADWSVAARRRRETPDEYDALVAALADEIGWAEQQGGTGLPVGIGAAGLIAPSGLALTANLAATGHPFPADIARAAGRAITYVNDCRALTLSEAVFGAARGHSPVVGLILGTGVGGGVAVNGALLPGRGGLGGEFGHMPAPAHLVAAHGLPVHPCGCGRTGCVETYIAGPGLTRLAGHLTGQPLPPAEIAARRGGDMASVWTLWRDMVTELLVTITFAIDPEVVVLGGGLSRIDGLAKEREAALAAAMLDGFAGPRIVSAEGGDSSGARGAAYAALGASGAQTEGAHV